MLGGDHGRRRPTIPIKRLAESRAVRDCVVDLQSAVAEIPDGATVAVGGSPLARKPIAAIRALAQANKRELELLTFTGSLDVELLVRAGALRAVRASYVSLGEAGRARAFEAAVLAGEIEDLEESEWMLLGRLRAAAAGLPFLPTRAGLESALVAARGLREVSDPYTGVSYLAVPALAPDVAIIHAWRADPEGNVQMPWPPEHLADVDVLVARAAKRAVVTVERIVSTDEVMRAPERTVLFGFEVGAVVEAPRGAWPTASAPDYRADLAALREQ
jgi:glutaconate CoA-transferase subunit A